MSKSSQESSPIRTILNGLYNHFAAPYIFEDELNLDQAEAALNAYVEEREKQVHKFYELELADLRRFRDETVRRGQLKIEPVRLCARCSKDYLAELEA